MRSVFCFFVITVLASMSAAAQTPPTTPPPPPVPPTNPTGQPQYTFPNTFYQNNDVTKSLQLNQDQIGRLNTLTTKTRDAYRDQYNRLGDAREAERYARYQSLNQQYYGDWNKSARGIFNDNQWQRYQQLYYQYHGFGTLYNPEVQKQLSLSADQVRDIQTQTQWSDQQLAEINRIAKTDQAKARQLYSDYWKARNERFEKYLNPDQRKIWQSLTGDPYTFTPVFVSP